MLRTVLDDWSIRSLGPGPYPQRDDRAVRKLDRWLGHGLGRLSLWASTVRRWRGHRFAAAVERLGPALRDLDEEALRGRIDALRERLPRTGLRRAELVECFALVGEVCARQLGKRPYPVQHVGGYVLALGGQAEMATGEGKSLTAVLPAVAVALARMPVHVVTVNDYLARRDAEAMRPVYEFCGLTVGWIGAEQDPATRGAMYRCDVTYCVNKDLVFDYLRDQLQQAVPGGERRLRVDAYLDGRPRGSGKLLRGLCYAIVDEADSILIDEARTPLIISSERDDPEGAAHYATALSIAAGLAPADYEVSRAERAVHLLPSGCAAIEHAGAGLGGPWQFRKAREELVRQALSALHLFERDTHYIVDDGKVVIVDEFTGRTMADRSWERGLHQLIETKENLAASRVRESIARITYQRFFRRYLRLAGMTGTGAEVAAELRSVFGFNTLRVPTHRPCRRRHLGDRVFWQADARWAAVVERVAGMRNAGRPVLVGTRSVGASEHLGALLERAGIPHTVLNARQDSDEACIVAQAGRRGQVTVATNMAGRGTDIVLDDEVRAAGGLHVILTEFHESRRVDRQLFGRAGRQGDPGSCEGLVSLEDELFAAHAAPLLRLLQARRWRGSTVPAALAWLLRVVAQGVAGRRHARVRRRMLEHEGNMDRSLAFAGRGE